MLQILWVMGDPSKEKELSAYLKTEILRRYCGSHLIPESKGGHGKPFFAEYPSLHYNISHSDGLCACVVSDSEAGIDVQKIPQDPVRCMHIAEHFFSPEEAETLRRLQNDPAALCSFFCRLWTARESYIKYTGKGLAEPFSTFSPDIKRGVINRSPEGTDDDTSSVNDSICYFKEYTVREGYWLTVCTGNELPDIVPQELPFPS